MDLRKVDLNLLVVFEALCNARGVTRAAEALGLSQPATSAALARLRVLFGDPLFVKTGQVMQPTPRALELSVPVSRLMSTLREDVLKVATFDASHTTKTFDLIAPDIAEVLLLPRLLAALRRAAPLAKIRLRSMPRRATAVALESGDAELALGYLPDLQKGSFFQQRLFQHRYVCIVRRDHPAIGARLTLKAYLAGEHVVVRPEGREHLVEQFLSTQRLDRKVVLEVSHFMSLLTVVAESDLLATIPLDLAQFFVAHGKVRIIEAPVKAPEVQVHQFWHQRLHKDAANQWLRKLVHDTLRA